MFETLTNGDYLQVTNLLQGKIDKTPSFAEAEAIVRFAADVAQDCQWAEGSFDVALHELTAVDVVRNMARHYDGGMTAMVRDALAETDNRVLTASFDGNVRANSPRFIAVYAFADDPSVAERNVYAADIAQAQSIALRDCPGNACLVGMFEAAYVGYVSRVVDSNIAE